MKRLSKEQILMLHSQLIMQTGGIDGVRDFNLLESAIETPFQVFGGEELYPTIQAKGTRLGHVLYDFTIETVFYYFKDSYPFLRCLPGCYFCKISIASIE